MESSSGQEQHVAPGDSTLSAVYNTLSGNPSRQEPKTHILGGTFTSIQGNVNHIEHHGEAGE